MLSYVDTVSRMRIRVRLKMMLVLERRLAVYIHRETRSFPRHSKENDSIKIITPGCPSAMKLEANRSAFSFVAL